MCGTSAQHCDRSHVVTSAAVVMKGHISPSACGPSCECDCHKLFRHDLEGRAYASPVPIRRQHLAWRLAMWVYSDRWMGAAA